MSGNGNRTSGPSKTPKPKKEEKDPCDRRFSTELISVNLKVARTLSLGDDLRVELEKQGNYETVVCKTQANEVAGALAGIQGLDTLIGCLKSRRKYVATIKSIAGATVQVDVKPV